MKLRLFTNWVEGKGGFYLPWTTETEHIIEITPYHTKGKSLVIILNNHIWSEVKGDYIK